MLTSCSRWGLAVGPGDLIYAATTITEMDFETTILTVDPDTGDATVLTTVSDSVRDLAFDAEGRLIVVYESGDVALMDPLDGAIIRTYDAPPESISIRGATWWNGTISL